MFSESRKKWWVLIGIGLSGLIIAIDFTIVNTALAKIQGNLLATLGQLQWMIAGFGITFATLLTVMGRLGDMIGRRLLIYIGMSGFLLASIGAGLSLTPWELILFRFFQGICSAAIFPNGMAIISESFSSKERGKALGLYGAILGIGLALGPAIGGMIVEFISWRWIFFINVPVILVSFLVCIPTVLESKQTNGQHMDWWGMVLFILGLGSVIFAITEGPTFGMQSPPILISFFVGIALLLAFYFVEKKVRDPLCPFPLFRNRGFFLGTVSYVVPVSFVWPLLFLLPLYLQNILNYSSAQTGLILLTMTAMTVLASPVAGNLFDKKKTVLVIMLIFAMATLGYILQLFFSADTPLWLILAAFIAIGCAWGLGVGIGIPLVLSYLPSTANTGVVSGAVVTIVNSIAVLLLTIIGTIFRYGEHYQIDQHLQDAKIVLSYQQQHLIRALLSDPNKAKKILDQFGENLSEKIIYFFKDSFIWGFHLGIWILLILTLLFFTSIVKSLRTERKITSGK